MENLSALKAGAKCCVKEVRGSGAVKRRILDMGIVPGSEIDVIRAAPLGDPIEFKVKGYYLSLRKEEAKNILVKVL